MRAASLILVLTVSCLGAHATLAAQEGHPLKGSWVGTWGPSQVHANDLLVVLDWDGKTITGMINPGTDNMPVKNATLQPDGWVVHFETEGKDRAGGTVSYMLDGKIEGLAFNNRTITGTWKSSRESGSFSISRQ
jgi:hypothetical protein